MLQQKNNNNHRWIHVWKDRDGGSFPIPNPLKWGPELWVILFNDSDEYSHHMKLDNYDDQMMPGDKHGPDFLIFI